MKPSRKQLLLTISQHEQRIRTQADIIAEMRKADLANAEHIKQQYEENNALKKTLEALDNSAQAIAHFARMAYDR